MASQYTIKSGDTLSGIAQQNNTTVDELLKANQGNASVRSKNLIIAGGSISLPGAAPAAAPEPSNAAPSYAAPADKKQGVPSTSDPATIKTPDLAASFSSTFDDLESLSSDAASLFDLDMGADAARKMHDAADKRTAASYDISRDEIRQNLKTGQEEIAKARGMLNTPDVIFKTKVDDFVRSVDTFTGQIDRSLERLNLEEQAAYETNDATYLNNIRTLKTDYYNAQRQVLGDKMNMISTAFNTMMQAKQLARQETQDDRQGATDTLNTLIKAYAGTVSGVAGLPADAKAKMAEAIGTLGLPETAVDNMLKGSADVDVIHDATTGWIVAIDKNTGKTLYKTLMPGRTGTAPAPSSAPTTSQVLTGLSGSVGSFLMKAQAENQQRAKDTQTTWDGKLDVDDYYNAFTLWRDQAPLYLGTFFKNYPTAQYLNPDEKNDAKKQLISDLTRQEKTWVNDGGLSTLSATIMGMAERSIQPNQ